MIRVGSTTSELKGWSQDQKKGNCGRVNRACVSFTEFIGSNGDLGPMLSDCSRRWDSFGDQSGQGG